jgi:hypothetical protein
MLFSNKMDAMNVIDEGCGSVTTKVWDELFKDLIAWKNAPENTSTKSDYMTALHEEVCRWSDDINLHPLTNEMITPLLERVKHLNTTFRVIWQH